MEKRILCEQPLMCNTAKEAKHDRRGQTHPSSSCLHRTAVKEQHSGIQKCVMEVVNPEKNACK